MPERACRICVGVRAGWYTCSTKEIDLAYQERTVPDGAAELHEQLGTKPKFWYEDAELGTSLFKEARDGSGEDWAEKAACELCGLLGLPHPRYELASWRGKRGVVTPNFVPEDGRLVHGNELLAKLVQEYPERQRYRASQHTIRRVMAVLRRSGIQLPLGWSGPEITRPSEMFVGYLLLDAWIANQDRHHENWGLIVTREGGVHLAPTYDHASSLGRNETDVNRQRRLDTDSPDHGILGYVQRARSAFYHRPSDARAMGTVEVFGQAAGVEPAGARHWLHKLERISDPQLRTVLDDIPDSRLSSTARDFAFAILRANRTRLLEAGKALQ